MTLLIERPVSHNANATRLDAAPRRDSYITLPSAAEASFPAAGSYVTLPAGLTANGSKAQGSYVTLHSAPLGETEISYTRVG
ncbi:hypothetical protein D7Z96_14880 [Pseudarthrobacter phenanthrenivorans]|jgi:hypothetical protein|uniref:Uncharacterized protein n=2 Tax=Pseudarthrobacter phenanthrenivorans TaxID=361575 RepID=A0A3B0FAY0_PSEPS|nr:hypothetical protein [Pseudarthrobacter phenanthrenivorans]ADX74761.1 hypothetical protein Asphe3_36600 [Pseudarthrobacter phenanthrenivorans Sphe3]RKO22094.1 hypothetical protein D7Z96_14880 [Pseudarthrobacter phenanthrenivorans]